jgi:2-methylcitrate dehydratase PrpD
MTLSEQLIRHVRTKPIDMGDRRAASLYVLDAVANAVAGRVSAPGRILDDWAKEAGRDAGREAFVLGGWIHSLETDDLHRASVVHPGCVVVPVIVAVGRRRGLAGHALLDATLRGFEACCRVGMAVGPGHYRIWHNTATCGPYGSAMAAADLLGLDDTQARDALGNAGTQSAGFWQFLETGAMSKHLHAGRAAEAGIVAAQLAAKGFTGAPAILEGSKGFFAGACPDPQPDALLADPEAPWQLRQTSIKPWPSCRHTHPLIDAALEAHAALGGRAVAGAEIVTYQAAVDVCDRPRPESEYEAKFSLYHCAAVALADGEVGFGSFDEAARRRLAGLRDTITVRVGEPFAANYPRAWGTRIEVRTEDGRRFAAERRNCKGDPEMPLDADEMTAKARRLLAFGGLDARAAGDLIDGILALADNAPLPALPIIERP